MTHDAATQPALFDSSASALDDPAPAPAPAGRVTVTFGVCHPGVVLRAVVFVHGVLALAAAVVAPDVGKALESVAAATWIALPATLAWLAVICALDAALTRQPVPVQWLVAVFCGGASTVLVWSGWSAVAADRMAGGSAWPAAVAITAAGCAFAAAIFWWLQQRIQLLRPAAAAARLAELQSRIRPHFLFNTLNSAIALVRIDPARAESALEDLAELFRVALVNGEDQRSTSLGSEVDLARRYLAIEQLRFGERLRVRWDIEPAALRAQLPPLLLQPLVENAVKHGVEPSPDGGSVQIRARVRRGEVELSVANSVRGTGAGALGGHGIALRNVRERLRLLHDVAADFRAGLQGDVYRVRIKVPLS